MKFPKNLLLTFAALVSFGMAHAQVKEITTGNQQWIQYYNQSQLHEKWSLVTDGGFRTRNNFDEKSQYLVRTGLQYDLSPNLSITAGLGHLGFYSDGSKSRSEFRPYQELVLKNKFICLSLAHRYRVEERFFRNILPDNSKTNSFNFRFRYRLLVNIPLWQSNKNPNKELSLNVGDEIFIHAGKDIVFNVFNQNRLLIGPAYQLNKKLAFSLTYNRQFSASNAPRQYQNNNIIWLGINHKMSFISKK